MAVHSQPTDMLKKIIVDDIDLLDIALTDYKVYTIRCTDGSALLDVISGVVYWTMNDDGPTYDSAGFTEEDRYEDERRYDESL